MTGHRRITSKIKLRLFISCFNRVNDRAKLQSLIIEVEEKSQSHWVRGQKDSRSKIMKFLQTNTENLNNGNMHKCLHFLDIFVCFLGNYP